MTLNTIIVVLNIINSSVDKVSYCNVCEIMHYNSPDSTNILL